MDIVECGEKGEEGVEICETIEDDILCNRIGGEGGEGPGVGAGQSERGEGCGTHQQEEECHPPSKDLEEAFLHI